MQSNATDRRQRGRRGVEMLEFTFVFLPLIGFVFLLLDMSWAIYARSSLQFAVREGCRFAVTNRTVALKDSAGKDYGLLDSVKYTVQSRAMGFLGSKSTDAGYAKIKVRFYDPNSSLTTALADPTSTASPKINVSGNLVEVSVEDFQLAAFAPVLRNAAPLKFTARSSDRMEGDPPTGAPNLITGKAY